MELVFLGTSSTFPTKERNHPAILLKHEKESILFDCGEGTQRQFRISGENPMRITKIFMSHWHGDHSLGIPGLLTSYGMNKREKPLTIFGPKGIKKSIDLCKEAGFEVVSVHDEGEYYETRDMDKLADSINAYTSLISSIFGSLKKQIKDTDMKIEAPIEECKNFMKKSIASKTLKK